MLVRRIFIGLVVALLLNVIYNTVSPATTAGPIKKKSTTSSSDAITDAKTIDDFQKQKQSSGHAKTVSESREEENRGKPPLAQDEHRSSSGSGTSLAGDNSNGKSQQDDEDEPRAKTDGNTDDDDAGGAATATGPGNADNDDTDVDSGNENATHPNDHFAKDKKVVVGRVSVSDALGQERRVQELVVFKLRERARKIAAQRHKKLASDPELAQNATALKLLHSPPLDKVVGFRQMASSFLNKSFTATARQNLFVYDTVWPTFPEVLSSSVVTDQKSHTLYGGAEGSQSVPNTKEATLASRGKSGQKAPKTPPTFTSDGIQEDVTEGHCNLNSDKFNIFSQEFSDTESRVLRLMDKFDALEQSIRDRVESLDNTTTAKKFEPIDAAVPKNDDPFVRKALAQQRKISRLVEAELRAELRDGEKVAKDHAAAGSNATEAGEHPTIRWMRKSRWLLDVFVPFMDEQSCVPVAGPTATDESKMNGTSSSAPQPPPSAYQFHVRKSTKEVWAFYNFNNVCVNSETGGLSAVFPPTMDGLEYYGVNDLTEERRLKVRNQLFIWNRAKMNRTNPIPKCFVDVPILLHPILFQSDNLGHVLYRILATRSLLSDFTKVKNQGYEKTVLGFLVAHSSQKTFGLNNKYRMWYQMLGHRWFSVKTSGNIREHTSNLPKGSEENEICFKRVFLGWSIVPMYQKRSGRIANKDLRINGPAVQRFRNRVDACYDMPARPVHQGSGAVSDDDEGKRLISASGVEKKKPTASQTNGKAEEKRPRITIVTRRTRRILNQAEFAHRIAARYQDADVHVADFEGMTVHQQVNITHNTDVLISIHGTALQYVLNQPPNGVMVEIQYSTGKYYCTNPGINPANRIFCEFGRTSTVARVTHIVHRVTTKNTTGCNMKTFHDCDVTLTVDAQNEIIDSAMCSLQAGFVKATKECNANTRRGQSMISDALK